MEVQRLGSLSAEERERRVRLVRVVMPAILACEFVFAAIAGGVGWLLSGSVGWAIVSVILAGVALVIVGGIASVLLGGQFLPMSRYRPPS